MVFEKAKAYCAEAGIDILIENARAVIIGFSGGADSSVLLSYFAKKRESDPELYVAAAHVNHMIRGAEADRDEEFCRAFCEKLEIELFVKRADVPALAREWGMGTEEAARKVRYDFFEDLIKEHPEALVATAHNSDDNLETVLFNLIRGSGTKGMTGISPVRDGRYIRPLLSCTSEEIRTFARDEEIPFVFDSTNAKTEYTRNTLRHKVIPELRGINPRVADAVLRMSALAREDCEYIESEAERIAREDISPKMARELHPALFSRVLLLLYRREAGSALNVSEKNVSDCRRLLQGEGGGRVSLPGGLAFFADRDRIYVASDPRNGKAEEKRISAADERVPLFEESAADFGDFFLYCTRKSDYIADNCENIYKLSLHVSIDCDKINGNLSVRCRRAGDTILMRRMNRRLKKLFCDMDVPRRDRDSLPVIEDDEGIVYVPYIGTRDGIAATEKTERILNLHILKRS